MTAMTTAVSSTGQPVPPDVPPPVTTSRVPPRTGSTRGAMAHRTAVARLVESYRAIPPGAGVRLPQPPPHPSPPRGGGAAREAHLQPVPAEDGGVRSRARRLRAERRGGPGRRRQRAGHRRRAGDVHLR